MGWAGGATASGRCCTGVAAAMREDDDMLADFTGSDLTILGVVASAAGSGAAGAAFIAVSVGAGAGATGAGAGGLGRLESATTFFGAGCDLSVDGGAVGKLKPGTYVYADRPAGQHLLLATQPLFPGDTMTGVLSPDYEDAPLFADEDSMGDSEPCPVLDPATGTCDLYSHRPVVCRTFGPPMRTADGDLATCELCFITASTQEIAAAELDPAVPALESASNEAYNHEHHVSGETIVAFVLRF